MMNQGWMEVSKVRDPECEAGQGLGLKANPEVRR